MKNEIIAYLKEKYAPHTIILYGSYADGSNNENSDFDALIITDEPPRSHDSSTVAGVMLDVFIYPTAKFDGEIDCENFLAAYGGEIALDERGTGKMLKEKVIEHIESVPFKTEEELREELSWCEKMLLRAKRGDAEGFFRWHWLLFESLEIYCDIQKIRYFGGKKMLKKMKNEDPEAFSVYEKALEHFEHGALEAWVLVLKNRLEGGE